jgi:hypothetical protein
MLWQFCSCSLATDTAVVLQGNLYMRFPGRLKSRTYEQLLLLEGHKGGLTVTFGVGCCSA